MKKENYELHKEDEDWKPSEQEKIQKYAIDTLIQQIRTKMDFLWNAGMQKNGDYLPNAKNQVEEWVRGNIDALISQAKAELREKVETEFEEYRFEEVKELVDKIKKEVLKLLT